MEKPATEAFDPKEFLARVGEGKTIAAYHKDDIVFAQGDVADTVFYLQKGRLKVVVVSEQGKEAVVGILEPGQFFGEGCMNGPFAADRHDDRDGGFCGHRNHQSGDARCASQRAEILRDVHGVSVEAK